MSLILSDRWLWDFWLARDGDDHHVFYLQAPRSLEDPVLRHRNATIGHAVSRDLVTWEVLPDALGTGPPGSWDDLATWTGSVFRDGDGWAMLYTGISRGDDGQVQRIGLARSDDLIAWRRHAGNPVIVADPARYETLDLAAWYEEAWRDPSVHQLPGTRDLVAFLTARARDGDPARRGVIAAARARQGSPEAWEVLDPVTAPGRYGHLEVPQLIQLDDRRWCLLFSVPATVAPRGVAPGSEWTEHAGTHFLLADHPLGPYDWSTHGRLLADAAGTWYAAKLVERTDGALVCLAWQAADGAGRFVGALGDPMPVEVGPDGPRVVAPQ